MELESSEKLQPNLCNESFVLDTHKFTQYWLILKTQCTFMKIHALCMILMYTYEKKNITTNLYNARWLVFRCTSNTETDIFSFLIPGTQLKTEELTQGDKPSCSCTKTDCTKAKNSTYNNKCGIPEKKLTNDQKEH